MSLVDLCSQELFDEYIKDWKPRFAVGQLVSGRITNINKPKNQVELSLRKNDKVKRTKKEEEPTITFEGLQEGQVYKGVVKRVESYGAFIRIQGSPVSGLCHKSEVSEL
jgi:rRNA biogenesis protein RRP5